MIDPWDPCRRSREFEKKAEKGVKQNTCELDLSKWSPWNSKSWPLMITAQSLHFMCALNALMRLFNGAIVNGRSFGPIWRTVPVVLTGVPLVGQVWWQYTQHTRSLLASRGSWRNVVVIPIHCTLQVQVSQPVHCEVRWDYGNGPAALAHCSCTLSTGGMAHLPSTLAMQIHFKT